MIALRLLCWVIALGFVTLWLVGCSAPWPGRASQWHHQPMAGGPSLYWTCINGDRVYALQPLASRASVGLWPGASIAVAAGGCK